MTGQPNRGRRKGSARKVGPQLSGRDWAILDDLARVRLLTGRFVQRLHVHEGSPLTQARRTRATLQRLNDLNILTRLERRIGGVHAGSAGFVFGLSTLGQRLTKSAGPAGGVRLRRPWEPSSAFTDHVLAVAELYVDLRDAERRGELELISFDAEPACWRYWSSVAGERLVLKPDAFVSCGVGETEHRSFVEVNRSTESRTVVRRKAEAYVSYWRSGVEQERHGVFPRVVFVVPDQRRLEQVVELLGRLDPETWQLFQVVLPDSAVAALSGRSPPADRRIA